jgi:hypothetical protein
VITGAGLADVEFGPIVDTFGGAAGEEQARQFGTHGYPIRARKPRGESEGFTARDGRTSSRDRR